MKLQPLSLRKHDIVSSIFRKLGIGSRADLAALFVKTVRRGREFEPRQG